MTTILVPDTTVTPYGSVVFVMSAFPNGGVYGGSGVLVGPNDVLTAGHMVYDARYGGAATQVTVIPGYDPDYASNPFGSYTSTSYHYLPGINMSSDGSLVSGNNKAGLAGSEADIALIDLSTAVGNQTGWMYMDPAFSSGTVNMTGYPAASGFNMTTQAGHVTRSGVDSTLFYDGGLAATPGNSGGPLWYEDKMGNDFVVGIVSTTSWGADIDGGFNTIKTWIAGNDYLIGGPVPTPSPTPVIDPVPPPVIDPTPTPTKGGGKGGGGAHGKKTSTDLSQDDEPQWNGNRQVADDGDGHHGARGWVREVDSGPADASRDNSDSGHLLATLNSASSATEWHIV